MDVAATIRRAESIRARSGFDGSEVWLTFYMASHPDQLRTLADKLRRLGGTNLDDAHGGFLYPKLLVANRPDEIVECVQKVLAFASDCEVHVLSVDIDTTSDERVSKFVELARFAEGNC